MPDFKMDFQMPDFRIPQRFQIETPHQTFFASKLYERIQKQVSEAEETLLKEGEQLVLIHHPPAGEPIRVTDVGYHNPVLIVLDGYDSQELRCRVLVHVEAFHMVMKALPAQSGAPRRQIGFAGEVAATSEGEPGSGSQQNG